MKITLSFSPKFLGKSGENDNVIFGGGAGSGIEIEIEPLPAVEITPDPVIVEARLNNRYARQFQPAYPSGQLRREEEGVVSVRVLVGTDGRAKQVELIDSPHPDFWEATRRHALKKWRFTPWYQGWEAFRDLDHAQSSLRNKWVNGLWMARLTMADSIFRKGWSSVNFHTIWSLWAY